MALSGKRVEKLHRPRHLESRHPLAAPVDQFSSLETAFPDYKGLADLPQSLVGNTDDRRLRDAWVVQQEAFDLGRIRIEAAHDEHVLLAADDAQAARVVEVPQISGVQPAVGIDRLGGSGGIVEVALP